MVAAPRLQTLLAVGAIALVSCRASTSYQVAVPLGLDLFVPVPEDNRLSRSRVALGRRLFFDAILSGDARTSCGTCHRPDRDFSDTSAVSLGAYGRVGRRNAPSLLNAAYRATFSWDGRARSLEEQVLLPIADSLELHLPLAQLETRLRARPSYRDAFRREFGGDPDAASIARALASYVRTLRVADSPLDRYRNGDSTALSARARRGLELFSGRAGCATCHVGPLFSDGDFHNTGVAWQGGSFRDDGRWSISRNAVDRGSFKTPSLRNVASTPPYMHDGSIKTLDDVIDFYDAGGRQNPTLDPFVQPLGLTPDEKADLVAFLEALTGKPVARD